MGEKFYLRMLLNIVCGARSHEEIQTVNRLVYPTYMATCNVYLMYGYGGTRKTYLWSTIISRIRLTGKVSLSVASSGIASLLLPGGRTSHSRF
ncbi:DNA helicase, partial [Tanacetum coccineum]